MKKKGMEFVGANISKDLKKMMKRDALAERRSLSQEMEHLMVLGLMFRGYDVSKFIENADHNADLVRMQKLIKKEVTSKRN